MAESTNVEKLQEGYRLWNDTRGDSAAYWLDLIAEDVTWRSLAGGAPGMGFTQDCTCKADVIRYFEQLGQDWKMIHYTPEEFIAQGDRVVVLSQCAWQHKKTGKGVESPKADVIRFQDGKIVEFFEFYDTAKALSATVAD